MDLRSSFDRAQHERSLLHSHEKLFLVVPYFRPICWHTSGAYELELQTSI